MVLWSNFLQILSLILIIFCQKINSSCNYTSNSDAVSCVNRAKSQECKIEIESLACKLQEQQKQFLNLNNLEEPNQFYKLHLKRLCPRAFNPNDQEFYKGCVNKHDLNAYLNSLKESNKTIDSNSKIITITQFIEYKNLHSLKTCINICLTLNQHKYAAYNPVSSDCICFKSISRDLSLTTGLHCEPPNLTIYSTGLLGKIVLDQNSSLSYCN